MKRRKTSNRLLALTFVVSAVSGTGLHVAGHGGSHELWHSWALAHVLSSLLWLVAVVFHIYSHMPWYRSIVTKGIGRKSRVTLALSAGFVLITATGIVLLVYVEGANSPVGLWHYVLGLLLIVLCLIHAAGRIHAHPGRNHHAAV